MGKMGAVFLFWFFMDGKLSFGDGNKPISYLKSNWDNAKNTILLIIKRN